MHPITSAIFLLLCLATLTGCWDAPSTDFTEDEFLQVHDGVSPQEVEKIAGSPPASITEIKEDNWKLEHWNDKGGMTNVSFRNGQAVAWSRFDNKKLKSSPHNKD